MNQHVGTSPSRIERRKAQEGRNIYSRLPAVYWASRGQAQRLLQIGGGLSIVEWRTLWDLHEAGPLTIRDLAEIQCADHSLLSRALPEMRRKGYVSVERDSSDGRQILVRIAPAGLAAYREAAPIMARRRAALREVFTSEELDSFVSYLDRLDDLLHRPDAEFAGEEEITG